MSGIEHATNRSIKPFKSSEEYLYAMKEDLAEWLGELYDVDITVNNFLEVLETGSLLCHHANNVTRAAHEFLKEYRHLERKMQLPKSGVTFISSAQPATFLARDNVTNFINWCRKQLYIKDVLMFETEDLVLRKNEKNFVLCLLEVARRASRFGMAAPVLIQLEQEIEEEIREGLDLPPEDIPLLRVQRQMSDFKNLDEMVQHLVSRCTCPYQFPMVKVSEGKYRVGDSSSLIFVRILRNHVMVRVGGGWDTLEHYLDKHDPCRCTSLTHKQPKPSIAQRPAPPTHEVRVRMTSRRDSHGGAQATLLVSRSQSPLAPVHWTPSAPSRAARPSSTSGLPRRASPSPEAGGRSSPGRPRERSATPSRRKPPPEVRDYSAHSASTRTGREVTRASPSPRLSSSLPRPVQSSFASPVEAQRPRTPLVFQRTTSQLSLHPQHSSDSGLTQFASKLRPKTDAKNRGSSPVHMQYQEGLVTARSCTPVRSYIPAMITHQKLAQPASVTSLQPEDMRTPLKASGFIRTFSPTRQMRSEASTEPQFRPLTTIGKELKNNLVGYTVPKKANPDSSQAIPMNSALNGGTTHLDKWKLNTSMQNANHGDSLTDDIILLSVTEPGPLDVDSGFQESGPLDNKDSRKHDRDVYRGYLFTPPPISPEKEASLYRSLEHEILSNLKLLKADSDDDNNSVEEIQNSDSTETQGVRESSSRNDSVPSISKPSLDNLRHAAHGVATVSSHSRSAPCFNVAVSELIKDGKVHVEGWKATLPSRTKSITQAYSAEEDTGHLTIPQNNFNSSWSSLGSSLDSEQPRDGGCGTIIRNPRVMVTTAPGGSSTESSTGSTQKPTKPRIPSFKQKRALKMPERVPSIYKLKLRPRVRPRRDHRPEKNPSKIPTPLSYSRSLSSRDTQRVKKPAAGATGPKTQCSQTFAPTPYSALITTEETPSDHVQESWV